MVAIRKHLDNAPITEAVIDLRVRRDGSITESDYQALHDAIREEFPGSDTLYTRTFQFRIDKPDQPIDSIDHGIGGYRYTSSDKTYVVQFRNDGFSLSRLAPYETWDILKAKANRLWEIYRNGTKPSAITRVAVRYINTILLQFIEGKIDLEDYFLIVPTVPPELPQATVSSLSQLKLHDIESGASANFNISTMKIEENGLPILFDIDVFKGGEFQVDSHEYWDLLEKLRELKNKIFFHSITGKTLELFT